MNDVVFLDAGTLPQGLVFPVESGVRYRPYDVTTASETASRVAPARMVITNKVRLGRAELDAAPHLRLIAVAAAGTDNVDLVAARERGIEVRNVPDYGSDSVAEHALASLFCLRRSLFTYAAAAADGRWSSSPHFCWHGPQISDLRDTRLGIVGRGRIGEALARLARGVGMEVVFAAKEGETPRLDELPLADLLAKSDAVSLHVPLTPKTRGMIDGTSLGRMKPNAILINTGRGALVDAKALANALKTGVIAGAAIDVLEVEPPPPDHPLLEANIPNLLLTPHVAWASDNAQATLAARLTTLITQKITDDRIVDARVEPAR